MVLSFRGYEGQARPDPLPRGEQRGVGVKETSERDYCLFAFKKKMSRQRSRNLALLFS